MAHDPPVPRPFSDEHDPFPLTLWVIWTLAVVASAIWSAWPSIWHSTPLDTLQLIIASALTGVAGLLVLTILEIRLAPWRFLD